MREHDINVPCLGERSHGAHVGSVKIAPPTWMFFSGFLFWFPFKRKPPPWNFSGGRKAQIRAESQLRYTMDDSQLKPADLGLLAGRPSEKLKDDNPCSEPPAEFLAAAAVLRSPLCFFSAFFGGRRFGKRFSQKRL